MNQIMADKNVNKMGEMKSILRIICLLSGLPFTSYQAQDQNNRFPIALMFQCEDTVGIRLSQYLDLAIKKSYHLRPPLTKEPYIQLSVISKEIRTPRKTKRSPIQPMSVIGLVWSAKTDSTSPVIYVDMMVDTCTLIGIEDFTKTIEVETLRRLNRIRISFE